MKILFLLANILIFSCSSPQIQTRTLSPDFKRTSLIPKGLYHQKVSLELTNGKKFDFNGILKIDDEFVRIAVLAHMGVTAFKITDSLKTKEIKVEIFIEPMKKYEPKVHDYYTALKEMILAPLPNPDHLPVQIIGKDKTTIFSFRHYDANAIPDDIFIEHKDFKVDLKVTGYEL